MSLRLSLCCAETKTLNRLKNQTAKMFSKGSLCILSVAVIFTILCAVNVGESYYSLKNYFIYFFVGL